MIRIAHFSDLHYGTKNLPEADRCFGAAIDRARTTSRPVLIEAHTFRLRGHAAYDTCDYMKPGEADAILAAAVLEHPGEQRLYILHAEALATLPSALPGPPGTP